MGSPLRGSCCCWQFFSVQVGNHDSVFKVKARTEDLSFVVKVTQNPTTKVKVNGPVFVG